MLRAVAAVRGRRRRARGADGAVEERGAELDMLLLAIDGGGCSSAMERWQEEEEEDDMWGP